jgi:branched-chain amino acid transport system ATP-binding protein
VNPLVIRNLSCRFGGVRALDNVSLQLEPGERRAIIGTNGAGKTTLFNVINGQLAPSSGKIWILGEDATHAPIHRRAALGLGRTFQITSLFPRLSVLDNMLVAVAALSRFHFVFWRPVAAHAEIIDRACETLARWNLWDLRDELVGNLSYACSGSLKSCWRWREARSSCCSTSRWRGFPRPKPTLPPTSSSNSTAASRCC